MKLNKFISMRFMTKDQERFFRSYLEAIYFTETGDTDQPEAGDELHEQCLVKESEDCRKFFNAYHELFEGNEGQAAHDFWFTRNGHGVGFWDRPELYGERNAEELTRACKFIGETRPEFKE